MNSKLESVIEDEVCTELKSAGIHALNGVLGNVTKLLNPYLAPAPAPLNPDSVLKELLPDAKERAKLLNIQTHWAFRFLNDVFSEIFGKRDDQGLLGINEFMDGVTSGGNVSLQINTILLNSTNALTTGKITLTNLVITGLDTFTNADLYVVFVRFLMFQLRHIKYMNITHSHRKEFNCTYTKRSPNTQVHFKRS